MADTMIKLSTALGNYPHTAALKKGEITAPGIAFDFADVKPMNRAFKPMAMEQKFDISEMAIVTFLLAHAFDKPIVLLPCVMASRFQHNTLVYNAAAGKLTPQDLPGKRIGVRSYTQTTGVWIRGIIENDYGVDLNKAHWTVQENAHIAEYKDPPGLNRVGLEYDLMKMMMDREVDAVIFGLELPDDPRIKTVIEDPRGDAQKWYQAHGCVPINHMVVVKKSLAQNEPAAVKAAYQAMLKSRQAAPAKPGEPDTAPFGFDAVRPGMELIIDYAFQQKIIPRRYSVDELFADAHRILD
jgi:4,5-dihydroxyphthalate decarboxylase